MIDNLPMEVFLYLAVYLTFESIKKCREVSSSWKIVIENSGLLSSAAVLVNPVSEERILESKLLSIVKIRIIRCRENGEKDINKVSGIFKKSTTLVLNIFVWTIVFAWTQLCLFPSSQKCKQYNLQWQQLKTQFWLCWWMNSSLKVTLLWAH